LALPLAVTLLAVISLATLTALTITFGPRGAAKSIKAVRADCYGTQEQGNSRPGKKLYGGFRVHD